MASTRRRGPVRKVQQNPAPLSHLFLALRAIIVVNDKCKCTDKTCWGESQKPGVRVSHIGRGGTFLSDPPLLLDRLPRGKTRRDDFLGECPQPASGGTGRPKRSDGPCRWLSVTGGQLRRVRQWLGLSCAPVGLGRSFRTGRKSIGMGIHSTTRLPASGR